MGTKSMKRKQVINEITALHNHLAKDPEKKHAEIERFKTEMDNKAQHTPTPWKQTHSSLNGFYIGNEIDSDLVIVQSSREDAAFIVRAVNAHDDLLLALEDVKRYLIKIVRKDARSYVEQISDA